MGRMRHGCMLGSGEPAHRFLRRRLRRAQHGHRAPVPPKRDPHAPAAVRPRVREPVPSVQRRAGECRLRLEDRRRAVGGSRRRRLQLPRGSGKCGAAGLSLRRPPNGSGAPATRSHRSPGHSLRSPGRCARFATAPGPGYRRRCTTPTLDTRYPTVVTQPRTPARACRVAGRARGRSTAVEQSGPRRSIRSSSPC